MEDQVPEFEREERQLETSEERKGKELTDLEEKEWREGQALYEMVSSSPGWQVMKKWLEDMAHHSWIDPRTIDKPGGSSKEEWEWRELNAFHAANNAKELIERIEQAISRSEYLARVRSGEIQTKGFKI